MFKSTKNKFKKLTIASQIGIFIGSATIIFWHFFLIFEFWSDFNQRLDNFQNIIETKIYQFRDDNQYAMASYDYERIRINLSNIDFKIPIEEIYINGNFDETIVEYGKKSKSEPIFKWKKSNNFFLALSNTNGFYYQFNIPFFEDSESTASIGGIIKLKMLLNNSTKSMLKRYGIVLFFLFLQGVLIYLVGRKIAHSLSKISKEIVSNHDNLKISSFLGENKETQQFIHSYNEKVERESALVEKLLENEKEIAVANAIRSLTQQLAHDIRSPLAALKAIKDAASDNLSSDQEKLLNMSIERITDIANTILPKKKNESLEDTQESYFLWVLIDQIVSEKRVQYKSLKDIEITFKAQSSIFELNAICNQTEFMRTISNIIDNAIESKLPYKPLKLLINLRSDHNKIIISINDNGKGISAENLAKVFGHGFTFGKIQGSGLGLYQVKQSIDAWGGKIDIQSVLNEGTVLTIELKKSTRPLWLAEEIKVKGFSNILILDDEEYVFQILKDRFNGFEKTITYFKTISDFKNHLSTSSSKNLCFVDHDLKQEMRGLDLIEQLEIQKTSILLTGNYDDRQVQQNSLKAGIKILPKPLIHEISIVS